MLWRHAGTLVHAGYVLFSTDECAPDHFVAVHSSCIPCVLQTLNNVSYRTRIRVSPIPARLPRTVISLPRRGSASAPPRGSAHGSQLHWLLVFVAISIKERTFVAPFPVYPNQRPETGAQIAPERLQRTLGRLPAISLRYRALARPSFWCPSAPARRQDGHVYAESRAPRRLPRDTVLWYADPRMICCPVIDSRWRRTRRRLPRHRIRVLGHPAQAGQAADPQHVLTHFCYRDVHRYHYGTCGTRRRRRTLLTSGRCSIS